MRRTLAEIAVEEGLVDEARAAAIRREAHRAGQPVVAALASYVPEAALAMALGRHLGMPVTELDGETMDPEALRELSLELASRRLLVPLSLDTPPEGPRVLRIAMADPTDRDAIAEVEIATGCRVAPVLAAISVVEEAIDRAYRGFVTAVMKVEPLPAGSGREDGRARAPFGGELSLATPAPIDSRSSLHRLEEEAGPEACHRALLSLLVARGVITLEEYQAELHRLLGRA